ALQTEAAPALAGPAARPAVAADAARSATIARTALPASESLSRSTCAAPYFLIEDGRYSLMPACSSANPAPCSAARRPERPASSPAQARLPEPSLPLRTCPARRPRPPGHPA